MGFTPTHDTTGSEVPLNKIRVARHQLSNSRPAQRAKCLAATQQAADRGGLSRGASAIARDMTQIYVTDNEL
jgi:hypothetical protein